MQGERKTKTHAQDQADGLRKIEALDAERKAAQAQLRETRQRLEYLLAASPAIIYTTKVSGDYACTFVSPNLFSIMGYTPQEMTTDPKGWPAR